MIPSRRSDEWKCKISEWGKGVKAEGRDGDRRPPAQRHRLQNRVARIPAIDDEPRLSTEALGLVLLGVAIGALVARFGNRQMVTVAGLAFPASLLLPALATNAATPRSRSSCSAWRPASWLSR